MAVCLLGYSLLENHFYELRLRQTPSGYPKIAIVVWAFLIEAYFYSRHPARQPFGRRKRRSNPLRAAWSII